MLNTFDPRSTGTPVTDIIPEVCVALQQAKNVVISAPPGAGKSTVLPLALINQPWLNNKKIVLLEPRRLAAASVAQRMASLLGEAVGQTVGYRVRFENKVSAQTRLEVVTEGILTRMLQSDNALEEVGLVIFDEFHERSIHADLGLALCAEVRSVLRPDMRIMVMSATLETEALGTLLQATIIKSEGRTFPVEMIYTGEQDLARLIDLTCNTIYRALSEQKGDILVFLPGEAEISRCVERLEAKDSNASLHPLYGRLPFAEQQAAILPATNGARKIVLATAIAETSLTIDGITTVIDCGFARMLKYNAKTGLSSLQTLPVTLDSAAQRAGRAGRLGPGTCYRMWSLATEQRLAAFRIPQILDADLVPFMLEIAAWGADNIHDMLWLDLPPDAALSIARNTLHQLGALNDSKITSHGKKMHALPCHPRIAHMLLLAEEHGMLSLATDIAALLGEKDPLDTYADADFTLRIEALRKYRVLRHKNKRFENIEKGAATYRRLFALHEDNGIVDEYDAGLLIAFAYPEWVAAAKAGYSGQFLLANAQSAALNADERLAGEPFLAVAQSDGRKGLGKIFLAAALNPKDLLSQAQVQDTLTWDSRRGGLISRREWKHGAIVLDTKPEPNADPESVMQVLLSALKQEGLQLLDFSDDVVAWQERMKSIKTWRENEGWPQVDFTYLLEHAGDWISPWLLQVKKPDDFRKINVLEALVQSVPYDKQLLADKYAPQYITVPSGSKIRLKYFADGQSPVLAVRLQELFGMLDTPVVNEGRIPVTIHLLSPGFKPVQVTRDLRSFWTNTYFEVRKELKRRYPRHSWPEDPLTAQAVRGVKRY